MSGDFPQHSTCVAPYFSRCASAPRRLALLGAVLGGMLQLVACGSGDGTTGLVNTGGAVESVAQTVPKQSAPGHVFYDDNGDGKSDIVWKRKDGLLAFWHMNGSTISSSYTVQSTVSEFFSGRGWYGKSADTAGQLGKVNFIWRTAAGTVLTNAPLSQLVPLEWTLIAAAGDYNGDKVSDILWRHRDGTVAIWTMTSGQISSVTFPPSAGPEWTIVDAEGDYDGDGKSDILWRNTSGTVFIWLMNGAQIKATGFPATVPTNWTILDGSGDYDGDGKSDVLWRSPWGGLYVWRMNGTAIVNLAVLGSVGPEWTPIDGSEDYNGDGKSDILFRNVSGAVAIWQINTNLANPLIAANVITTVGAEWEFAFQDRPTGFQGDFASIQSKLNQCFSVPSTARAAVDTIGNFTSFDSICQSIGYSSLAFVYRSDGRDWGQAVKDLLFDPSMDGAKFAAPIVDLSLQPFNFLDPRQLKHPVCDASPCVVAQFPWQQVSGRRGRLILQLGPVSGVWQNVGNQNPYDMKIEARLVQILPVNASPQSSVSYFNQARYESRLRLQFDPRLASANNVRAIRVKGPGLPSDGIALTRSSECTTTDRFAFAINATGDATTSDVANSLGQAYNYSPSAAVDFALNAARLDGSALALPVALGYAAQAIANLPAAVPAYSQYAIEVFKFGSSTPTTADEIIYKRIRADVPSPASGPTFAWPTLSSATVNSYLRPGGLGAGAITQFTASWSPLSGSGVDSGYLYGHDFLTVTGTSYRKRAILAFDAARYSDTTNAFSSQSDIGTGLSTSSFATVNPRCSDGVPGLPALKGSSSDYRELGLHYVTETGLIQSALSVWSN